EHALFLAVAACQKYSPERAWRGGVAKRPKDWCSTWQKMEIPAELQCEALQRFFNMAFSSQADDQEKAPSVVSELVKAHRLKLRSVEEVLVTFGHNLDGLLAMNEEAWQVYSPAAYLMHVSPKPAAAGWGWSRVGWSWASWWQYVEKCVSSLEADRAAAALGRGLLKLIQDREGTPLGEVQAWQEGDKLGKAICPPPAGRDRRHGRRGGGGEADGGGRHCGGVADGAARRCRAARGVRLPGRRSSSQPMRPKDPAGPPPGSRGAARGTQDPARRRAPTLPRRGSRPRLPPPLPGGWERRGGPQGYPELGRAGSATGARFFSGGLEKEPGREPSGGEREPEEESART
ncbi:unnamed protein product, partial [Prorocentrum cordatum]